MPSLEDLDGWFRQMSDTLNSATADPELGRRYGLGLDGPTIDRSRWNIDNPIRTSGDGGVHPEQVESYQQAEVDGLWRQIEAIRSNPYALPYGTVSTPAHPTPAPAVAPAPAEPPRRRGRRIVVK